jgi:hypothetical protein
MPKACIDNFSVLARLLLAAPLLAFVQCSAPGPDAEDGGGGWKLAGAPRMFAGEELFIHIDGGADIYYEYGFDRVEVREYRSGAGQAVTVEIYTMTSPESAFGIYTFKRGMEGEAVPLGNGGFFEGYYLNFWKGNCLVTLTGLDMDAETVEGLQEIAGWIDKDLPAGGKIPALIKVLDEENLVESSIKYFRGPLGLFNCRVFFTEDVFAFEEGAAGICKDGSQVFVFGYGQAEEAQDRFESAMDKFKNSPRYRDFRDRDSTFSIRDGEGHTLLGILHTNHIVLVVTEGDSAPAEALARRIVVRFDRVLGRSDS